MSDQAAVTRRLNQQAIVGETLTNSQPWRILTLGDIRRVMEGTEGMGDESAILVRTGDYKGYIAGTMHICGFMIDSNVREKNQ
ncbi:hypothetical protein Mbo2_045 [Rhodococcus phage Mbo2]|uniref:Uncharacterized protein n=1 Tax=Rhodococcus phage Mbo2 TaxID=2936911 RepID=A0A9E7IGW2_9CAUD|nr:hypothetical protein Mbo2_045 [Rhodococcus phage Mbo2]